MAINDLRTKITDLPLCEDIDSLETMIGVGTDGKMYRVDKDNVVGGGKWISIDGSVFTDGEIRVNNADILNAISTGGKIHLIAHNKEANSIQDYSFLIAESYIINSGIEADVAEASTYDLSSFRPVTGSAYFFNGMPLIVSLLYDGANYSIGFYSPEVSNALSYFEILGLFFEPIKNIGDLRIAGNGGSGGSDPR